MHHPGRTKPLPETSRYVLELENHHACGIAPWVRLKCLDEPILSEIKPLRATQLSWAPVGIVGPFSTGIFTGSWRCRWEVWLLLLGCPRFRSALPQIFDPFCGAQVWRIFKIKNWSFLALGKQCPTRFCSYDQPGICSQSIISSEITSYFLVWSTPPRG